MMKCPNCGTELEPGYALYPGLFGQLQIVKMEPGKKSAAPQIALCRSCGKLELYIDPGKIQYIQEL